MKACIKLAIYGRVKSFPRAGTRTKEERILKPSISKKGYYKVILFKNNESKTFRVNRLVAEAFIPNPEGKEQVNHKRGIKSDNRASELEWNTCSENIQHAIKTGLRPTKTVIQYNKEMVFIKEWSSIKDASKEINTTHITECCKGQRKTAGGYIWRYKDTQ